MAEGLGERVYELWPPEEILGISAFVVRAAPTVPSLEGEPAACEWPSGPELWILRLSGPLSLVHC